MLADDDGVAQVAMTRRRVASGFAVLALVGPVLGGCSGAGPARVAGPTPSGGASVGGPSGRPAVSRAAAAAGVDPVRPSPKVRPARPAPSARGADEPNAGTGNAGLDEFVRTVRVRLPDVAADRRDEEIEQIARQACAALAGGAAADRVVADTRALGTLDATATDQATARQLIKLAIDTVCPGQANRVDEF